MNILTHPFRQHRSHRLLLAGLLAGLAVILFGRAVFAHEGGFTPNIYDLHLDTVDHAIQANAALQQQASSVSAAGINAPCNGGPTIDGILLDECYVHSFDVNGTQKSVTVWYTKNQTDATRVVDGNTLTLKHWITADSQAVQVGEWFEDAWVRYHTDSGHHLYDNGCNNNVNVQLEDGVGWSGIAYWASSGKCTIGIDAPTVRNGGGQRTVYHEAQHYLQYSYDDGCYSNLKANYDGGSDAGNAEFTEGYADVGSDSVDPTIDAGYQLGSSYNPSTSMYDKNYGNRFLKYLIEQLGTVGNPNDPWHHIDAMYAHYAMCDAQDTLYVLDDLIPSLSGGKWSMDQFFLNFFAANWALAWADPATQSELVYLDDDPGTHNGAPLTQSASLSSGSQTWSSTSPDDYAAEYFEITPQNDCKYVEVSVDGQAGARLGINLMAADTSAPTSVSRSASIGEDYVRLFAGAGVHNKIVAAVNSFQSKYDYDVTFTCVSPQVEIMEPRQSNFALVGEPASPIAFLTRLRVTSNGVPVRGLVDSSFTFEAEGDAVNVVPGSFQEVGEEYWATMLPPIKPAGTTFVDYKACLSGTLCDTETDALLYVLPGNSDIGLVFDASGSMSTEDVTGEGTRIFNAQRAGKVVADLARAGDRLMVTDFSALNNPPGCGTANMDCQLDLRLLLPRTDVIVPATINAAKSAIEAITARDWTPIGPALQDAKNKLLAAPFSLNPKHIFLLSDGEENVKPLYNDVRQELIDSGVVINTIAFGPEADETQMAQIAADTGGEYRPVPTTDSGAIMAASADEMNALAAMNAPTEVQAAMSIQRLPNHLGLAEAYDYFETEAQDAARIFYVAQRNVPGGEWRESVALVDKSASTLRIVVAGDQPDSPGCEGWKRYVEINFAPALDADGKIVPGKQGRWIPISPVSNDLPIPSNWEVRNDTFDDVLIVTNPDAGYWYVRVRYDLIICAASTNDASDSQNVQAAATQLFETDRIVSFSAQSTIELEGRILNLVNGQATAGDTLPIVATVQTRDGLLPGAFVMAQVQKPNGTNENILLLDDGNHNDGAASDGIYGWNYTKTIYGGSYNVRIMASIPDPLLPGANIIREWNGGFWVDGPQNDQPWDGDKDKDGMPDEWERRCGLIVGENDAGLDKDGDGLTNGRELLVGTLPCQADTDHGGENDGSEVNGGRNPLWPNDDKVRPFGHIDVRPLNGQILVTKICPNVSVYVSKVREELGSRYIFGPEESALIPNLDNDVMYYVRVLCTDGDAEGKTSDVLTVTPKADPDAPAGDMLIENGLPLVATKEVTLYLSATDTPLEGMAEGANAHMTDQLSFQNQVSGGVEMRISNDPTMAGAEWEPFAQTKAWTLACNDGEMCIVYAQFRDAAENESLIVADSILLNMGADSDSDTIPDSVEGSGDTDGDGIPDAQDPDADNDGISDQEEAGSNPTTPVDTDGDGTPDFQDTDSDDDGVSDAAEGTGDSDGDGIPNYRDDTDNSSGGGMSVYLPLVKR
ncbi:MAG: VWA domain-containing protein [Caldilineaceae bacterium]|nr:VWA domain-containing protein [Caldilineaceae bacterium]